MRPRAQPNAEIPDIEKLLKDIAQDPPSRILAKYKQAFNMTDDNIMQNSTNVCRIDADSKLASFDEFLKKMLLHYKDIKSKIVTLMACKTEAMGF